MKIVVTEQQLKGLLNKFKKDVTPQQPSTMDAIRNEWSKINSDTSNQKGFAEGVSSNQSVAEEKALFDAKNAILKKLSKSEATFGTRIVDQKTFQTNDGKYHHFVVVEPTSQI